MPKIILSTIAGLLVGMAGALAYTHMAEGNRLAELQAQLDAANARNAKVESEKKELAQQTSAGTAQVDQLIASNEQLKKQLADNASAPVAEPVRPQVDPALLGIMGSMLRGGNGPRSPEQRMLLLQTRLKLNPQQAAKLKAAMEADQQARRDLFRQMRQNGGKLDPQAVAAANTTDKMLATVLDYQQQAEYKQLQADEKASRAETQATTQVDQMMPLLQLSDAQKEKAVNFLYEQQLKMPDNQTLLANPNPVAALTPVAQTTQTTLATILTKDQMNLYQQQQQVQGQGFGNFGQGRQNPGNAPATGATPASANPPVVNGTPTASTAPPTATPQP